MLRGLCVLLLASVAIQANAADKWQKVEREDGGFVVSLPGKPTIEKKGDGEQIVYAMPDKSGVYIVVWGKVPGEKLDLKDKAIRKEFFDGVQKGFLAEIKGAKLLETKDEVVDEEPARFMSVQMPDGKLCYYECVSDGEYHYQLMAIGGKDFVDSDEVEKFHDSFEFTEE